MTGEEHVIDASRKTFLDTKELWKFRELFYFFTWRDIKIKYKQTVLGFLWAVLQPTLMMLIITLFFGRVLARQDSPVAYPVYVFSGLLIWNLFASGLTNASNSMVNNSTIIKKIYFPRLVIPVASILVALFDFMMSLVPFLLLLIYYGQGIDVNALWIWPLAVVLGVLATLGMGAWLAALNVKYRDFRYVIPFLVQVLFFLTPVIYPVSIVKHPYLQWILVASPVYAPVELFRYPLTGQLPDSLHLAASIASALVFLVLGIMYFRRTEEFFADLT